MAKRGRPNKFTAEEIDMMKHLYQKYSADQIGKQMRCSPTTVLRAVDGKLKPKEDDG
jgi:hypothetical protein